MRTIAIDNLRRLSVVSVCLSLGFTRLRCANADERIKVHKLGAETRRNPRSITLVVNPDLSQECDAAFAKLLAQLILFYLLSEIFTVVCKLHKVASHITTHVSWCRGLETEKTFEL